MPVTIIEYMVEKLIHYIAGYIKGALAVTYKEVVSSESRFGTFKVSGGLGAGRWVG